MWDRATLKFNAKQDLKPAYWMAFLVCLVGGIITGFGGGFGSSYSSGYSSSANGYSSYYYDSEVSAALAAVAILAFLIGIAYTTFVASPVIVGIRYYFICAPYGHRDFSLLFSSFRRGRYMSIVKTMFLTNLFIGLWTLLFIIPGVVKSYQYRMVAYLIAENPDLSPSEAMQISKEMTDGHKMEMWVLDLSFIGWYLLGALALIVGMLFVIPYEEATWAQLYFTLRPYARIPANPWRPDNDTSVHQGDPFQYNTYYNNQPYNPQAGQPYNPQAGQPYNPQVGQPYNPQAGQPYNSQAGQPYNPQAGQPYNPQAGQPYNPQAGQPYNPQQPQPGQQPGSPYSGQPYYAQPSAQPYNNQGYPPVTPEPPAERQPAPEPPVEQQPVPEPPENKDAEPPTNE